MSMAAGSGCMQLHRALKTCRVYVFSLHVLMSTTNARLWRPFHPRSRHNQVLLHTCCRALASATTSGFEVGEDQALGRGLCTHARFVGRAAAKLAELGALEDLRQYGKVAGGLLLELFDLALTSLLPLPLVSSALPGLCR